MGIDIYARWRGMTREEEDAQITGFSTVDGEVGYLREAYHGEPYATRFLFREAFASPDASALISSALLKERLPEALRLVEERERNIYQGEPEEIEAVLQSYRDFVALCDKKEGEQKEPVEIFASY